MDGLDFSANRLRALPPDLLPSGGVLELQLQAWRGAARGAVALSRAAGQQGVRVLLAQLVDQCRRVDTCDVV